MLGTMLTVVVEKTIGCAPRDLLEFVLDIQWYAEIDDKIRPVHWVKREPNFTEFACRPKLAG